MTAQLKEARRYIENAREILNDKAGELDNKHYADKKYVRMAGNTAYNGVLEALDRIVPPTQRKKRKSAEYYQLHLAQKDKKLLHLYNEAYYILHLSLGYDGILNKAVAKAGISTAEDIIQRVSKYQA